MQPIRYKCILCIQQQQPAAISVVLSPSVLCIQRVQLAEWRRAQFQTQTQTLLSQTTQALSSPSGVSRLRAAWVMRA